MESDQPKVTVEVIVPARNEQDCIGRCLESLVSQQGIAFQITVVDDDSNDSTRSIAESFPGVRVISAPAPEPGISGKCNALISGVQGAAATWLLFTDADTVHYPGSLAASVQEAEAGEVDLLSYSPEQETGSWYERALLPVVFAELARTYPPDEVNDSDSTVVAANGQYILARRSVYQALGGHAAVAHNILEDVELARLFKARGQKLLFRFGAGRVRTRMYRSFGAMCEGWTKNLAHLFPHPLRLAALRILEFMCVPLFLGGGLVLLGKTSRLAALSSFVLGMIFFLLFLIRIRRAHFSWGANLLSFLGLPLFSSLLVRSCLHSHVRGAVTWKGRRYSNFAPEAPAGSSTAKKSEL